MENNRPPPLTELYDKGHITLTNGRNVLTVWFRPYYKITDEWVFVLDGRPVHGYRTKYLAEGRIMDYIEKGYKPPCGKIPGAGKFDKN